jgi:hypothetical protein
VSNADIRARPPADLVLVVGTSLKIPGTKRIVRESINAVHHTPRGKAIWINLDPPPSKQYNIWIKGDCQRIPGIFKEYERTTEEERLRKAEETEKKKEERIRAGEERQEKRVKEQQRKENNQRDRQRRKDQKEYERAQRLRKEMERKRRKEEMEIKKARRELERAIRPVKGIKRERQWTRPLTPPLSFDTDSTLSSPSMSDIEFASMVDSEPKRSVPSTPSFSRAIEYLPTPAPTPQKGRDTQEQDSPLKNKKRRLSCIEVDSKKRDNGNRVNGQHRNTMSIKFLTDLE